MGNATKVALAELKTQVEKLPRTKGIATAQELFSVGAALGSSVQLVNVLVSTSGAPAEQSALISKLFPTLSDQARELTLSLAAANWSAPKDLLSGVEAAGIRLIAAASKADLVSELYAVEQTISSDPELELALASKLGSAEPKLALAETLFSKAVSDDTLTILKYLIANPRGKKIQRLIDNAAEIIADQHGEKIAKVYAANKLQAAQLKNIQSELSELEGSAVKIVELIDPRVLGGLRIQLGSSVIDGTVSARLERLKSKLVG